MTDGWAVQPVEAPDPMRTCVLCGAISDDSRDIRPSMWPLRDVPKDRAWQSGQRCVDHMSCRIRGERSGRSWTVDDGTPPTVQGVPPNEPTAPPPPASGEVEPDLGATAPSPETQPAAAPSAPSRAPDADPEDWTF